MADLLETYNAMTGKSIKKFSSREAGLRQCANALLAAANDAGHAGVPPNTTPQPETVEELRARVARDKPGSLTAQLVAQVATQAPVAPRTERVGRDPLVRFRIGTAPTAKLHAESARSRVYKAAVALGAASPDGIVELVALNLQVGEPCAGHVQKLVTTAHLLRTIE